MLCGRTARRKHHEASELDKAKGVCCGRKRVLSAEQATELRQSGKADEKKAQLARELCISRDTL